MDLSFVIYYHSSRLDNLQQTIRMLKRREAASRAELVLVCQDKCDWVPHGFESVKAISLEIPEYHKPKMCNQGVALASRSVVAILDSDRVLPQNWFYHSLKLVSPKTIVTTKNLAWCDKPYTDEELANNNLEITYDIKSTTNAALNKNAFSGNALIRKEDYVAIGGMDERYVGYGFADNDMVENCLHHNYKFIFLNDLELHLFHERFVIINGEQVPREQFRLYTALNGLKFFCKWKKPPEERLMALIRELREEKASSPMMKEINRLARLSKCF